MSKIKSELEDIPYSYSRTNSVCLICRKPLSDSRLAYCEEHREYAERDSDILKKADPKRFAALSAGVINDCMNDYKSALRQLYKHPFDSARFGAVIRWRKYIESDHFQILSMGIVDPKHVIAQTEKGVMKEMEELRQAEIDKRIKEAVAGYLVEYDKLSAEVRELRNQIERLNSNVNICTNQ